MKIRDIKKKIVLICEIDDGPIPNVRFYKHLEFKEWEYLNEEDDWVYMINSYHAALLEELLLNEVSNFTDEFGNMI